MLRSVYADKVRVESIAKTIDGRDVIDIKVGNPLAEKRIMIVGAMHAREYISAQLVSAQMFNILEMEALKAEYEGESAEDMLNAVEIHFIPMNNPDGVTISQLRLDGLQNESIKQRVKDIAKLDGVEISKEYLRRWKSNANGVDLNRNFDALWNEYNDHKGHASSDHYKSTAPETEPEVRCLTEMIRKNKFDAIISYHTQGEVIYWNFNQTGELKKQSELLTSEVSKKTGYRKDGNFAALDTAGFKDWTISKMSIPSLTVEIGNGGSPVDSGQFDKILDENIEIVPMLLKLVYKGSIRNLSQE